MPETLKPTIDQIKVLSNASRLQIMALLFDGEKTISELAEDMGITVQTVHHHIHTLLDAGLIHVKREVTEGNIVKRYYDVEEHMMDSSGVWHKLTPRQKRKYKLAAMGIIKAMVNRGIRYIQQSQDIEHEVGWVTLEKVPFRESTMAQVAEILAETSRKLEALKDEDAEEEITVLISTLPG